jgi:hypothetical protein
MIYRLKTALLLILLASLPAITGCTSLQTVHGSPEAVAEMKIRVGDKVTLNYVTGHAEKVKLTVLGNESLTGVTEDGRTVVVAYDDLLSLEHKKVEVLKTAGATVGVVVVGAAVLGAVAVGSMVAVAGGT